MVVLALWLALAVPAQAQNAKHGRLKVGLVLGGGGAKGAAEVGVLKVIDQVGIPVDYIVGTSIGSIVGGLYSCGYKPAQLDSLFRVQDWLKLLIDPDLKLNGIMKGGKVEEMINDMTGRSDSINFDELPIPFRCVAVDKKTMTEVVLKDGSLARSMRASMSIPVVFSPVEMNGMELVDGGILNNLPVDVVRKMGADVVIAVDLTQDKEEATTNSNKKPSGLLWLIQWARWRPDLLKYNENKDAADVYINPDLHEFGAESFGHKKVSTMIKRGELAGEQARQQLIELKRKIYMMDM